MAEIKECGDKSLLNELKEAALAWASVHGLIMAADASAGLFRHCPLTLLPCKVRFAPTMTTGCIRRQFLPLIGAKGGVRARQVSCVRFQPADGQDRVSSLHLLWAKLPAFRRFDRRDYDFLMSTLSNAAKVDDFVKNMVDILETVHKEGVSQVMCRGETCLLSIPLSDLSLFPKYAFAAAYAGFVPV